MENEHALGVGQVRTCYGLSSWCRGGVGLAEDFSAYFQENFPGRGGGREDNAARAAIIGTVRTIMLSSKASR